MRLRLVLLLLLAAPAAYANPLVDVSFRCPTTHTIIDAGATTYEVAHRCRQPDDVVASVEHRTVREGTDADGNEVKETVDVAIEEWTYDFGSNMFLQYLRFENGRLVSVHEGPRGSAPPTRD